MTEKEKAGMTEPHNAAFKANIDDMVRYMRFIGVYSIVIGAIYCVGIITAIIGIPVIIMGVRLREAADGFQRFALSNAFEDLSRAVEKQTRSLFITYVLLIIGLVFMVIYFLVLIGVFFSHAY